MPEEKQPKTNICPKCGATFTCGVGTGGCWCGNFKFAAETYNYLKEKYNSCLCPSCLAAFSEKKEGISCSK